MDDFKELMPRYTAVPFADLLDAIEEALGCRWEPDEAYFVGHQLPKINMNSIGRIVSAFVAREERKSAAEIARLTAALEAKERQSEAAGRSYKRAREVIAKCAEALGNGAYVGPLASLEFAENLPSEIGLHVASLVEDRDTWKDRATTAEARLAKACEALKPFASLPNNGWHSGARNDDSPVFARDGHCLTVGDFRRASATLQEIGENNDE